MAKKRKAAAKSAQAVTTLVFGEEGIHPTTLIVGEETPTTLRVGEEVQTTFVFGEEHIVMSLPQAEHGLSQVSAEIIPFINMGDPGPQAIAGVARRAGARKKKR
ncbi:MAG: hypothetical protein ACREB2_07200 [Pseudolabrys sp.]